MTPREGDLKLLKFLGSDARSLYSPLSYPGGCWAYWDLAGCLRAAQSYFVPLGPGPIIAQQSRGNLLVILGYFGGMFWVFVRYFFDMFLVTF